MKGFEGAGDVAKLLIGKSGKPTCCIFLRRLWGHR